MYRFFESIAIVSGKPRNLFFHQNRIDKTFKHFYPDFESHHLEYLLNSLNTLNEPLVKCKFSYNESSFKFYKLKYLIKRFSSFVLIQADTIDYSYKYNDRSPIEKLQEMILVDSHMILVKKNEITDSSFSNLIFNDGYRWLTPSKPLLTGTMRSSLLAEWRIHEEIIQPKHLQLFKSFKLINALNSFEDSPEYPIDLINPTIIKT